jgi:hypothetical protein
MVAKMLGDRHGKDHFLEPSEGAWSCWNLDIGLLAYRTMRE